MAAHKWFLLNLILCLASCVQHDEFVIHGTTNRCHDGQYVMLFRFRRDIIPLNDEGEKVRASSDTVFSVDTTVVQNGRFEFRGHEDMNDLAVVTMGNWPDTVRSIELVLERGVIFVDLDHACCSGTLLNDAHNTYQQELLTEYERNGWSRRVDSIRYVYLRSNIMNPYGRSALYHYHRYSCDQDSFLLYCELMGEPYCNLPEITSTKAMLIQEREKRELSRVMTGKRFVDFQASTIDGNTSSISDYVGLSDYLYIDFWASWCAPCLREIPLIKAFYDKTDRLFFDVLSLSIDEDENVWRKTVDSHEMPGHALRALCESADLFDAYCIAGLPYGVIVDKAGQVVSTGVTGRSLDGFFASKDYFSGDGDNRD